MFVGLLSWWYGDGLNIRIDRIGERLGRVGDFFSIGLLAGTLFSPFRELSTGSVRGPLSVHVRAFFDNMLSRLIGAFIRLTMIGIGLVSFVGAAVYGLAVVAGWLFLPFAPLIGLIAAAIWMVVA